MEFIDKIKKALGKKFEASAQRKAERKKREKDFEDKVCAATVNVLRARAKPLD